MPTRDILDTRLSCSADWALPVGGYSRQGGLLVCLSPWSNRESDRDRASWLLLRAMQVNVRVAIQYLRPVAYAPPKNATLQKKSPEAKPLHAVVGGQHATRK